MKKLDNNQLNIKNTVKAINNTTSAEFKKLNSANNEVEIEYVGSFGDAIYDAFGSNKITKGTAIEILEDESLKFIEKDEVEEAIKCGPNSENIKITLKSGDEFLFVPNGTSYKLLTYTSNGNTVHFSNGLYELWDNVLGGNGNGTRKEIDSMSLYGNSLMIKLVDGVKIFYDTSKNNEITAFALNDNFYSVNELKRAIDTLRENLLAPLEQELRRATSGSALDTHPYIQQLKQKIQDIKEKYSYDNATDFSIEDYGVAIDGVGSLWSVKFENNKATSVVYKDRDNSPYLDGHVEMEI